MENIFVEFLPPWVETGLQPAFYDKESGTVLQQTARMYDRVNMLIRMFNKLSKETKETVEQYIEEFNSLYNYVHDYFDNLDVQEEVNNKLDEMVESGEFEELIEEYFNSSVKVIFPLYGKDGTDTLGDCSIIKTYTNKVIMIDTFIDDATCWDSIVQCLVDNNITKIDYFLVSHYDGDHYGNYQRLIYSGLINNARIILPKEVVGNGINKTGSDIKNALQVAGLTWEEADNETINIENNISMRLFNASDDDIQYYLDAGETNYNNFSICTEIKINGKKILFAGDILTNAMNYVANQYIDENGYELIKDAHHGFVGQSSVDFTLKVSPKYVLVPCSAGMISANLGHRSPQLNMWAGITPYIYSQGTQKEPTIFRVGYNETEILSDSVTSTDMGSDGYTMYQVNTNNSSLRTGSASYPFVNLNEASALINKNNKNTIEIDVEADQTDTHDTYFTNYDSLQVDFKNHTIANNIYFKKCKVLLIKNINLSSNVIYIEDCPVVYVTNFTSSNSVDGQLNILKSNVLISGSLTSTNATSCIKANHSVIQMNISSLSFTQTGTGKLFNGWGNTINFDNGGLTRIKTLKFATEFINPSQVKQNSIGGLESLTTLFSNDSGATSGDLSESINSYSGFRIYCQDKDGYKKVIEGMRTSSTSNNITFGSAFPSGDNTTLYGYYGMINLNQTSWSVSRQIQVNVRDTGNELVTGGTYIKVFKIVGIA